MRIVLESLRFIFIFFILSTILGVVTHLILLSIGVNADKYSWTAVFGVFLLMFALYRNRGWGKGYNKSIIWFSVSLIVLLSLLIPDLTPVNLHTNKYSYSYGFPFEFLTVNSETGTTFLLPKLLNGASISFDIWNILVNFLIFYFATHFILKGSNKKPKPFFKQAIVD
ncbi:hypothetical protein ACM26V_07645 [Salipaludibacillus sp. HK11]|uniref:hypothetical protein n=1 Tax=Salipaludibacillus sp. HK11 TaxID=3394320 RepID=UPI0039FBD9E1